MNYDNYYFPDSELLEPQLTPSTYFSDSFWCRLFNCPPLMLFIVLVLLTLIVHFYLMNMIKKDKNGNIIPLQKLNYLSIISVLLILFIDILFGMWIFNECNKGNQVNAWLIFVLALILPFIVMLLIFFGVLYLLGASMFYLNK